MQLHKTFTTNSRKRGSMLIEISIVLALFLIIFMSTSSTLSSLRGMSVRLQENYINFSYAKNNLETEIFNFENNLSGTSTTYRIFLTPCRITLTSTYLLNTLETLPHEDQNLGGDCHGNSTQLSEASTSPFHKYDNTLSSSFKITTIDIVKNIVYVAGISTSSTTPNFYTLDISDPQNIKTISSLYCGSIAALDATNKNVFLAVNSTTNQIDILDASNQNNISIISSTTLPNVAGSYPGAASIFYYDKKIYVGTHRTAGPEFHVFDVLDPSHPRWLGSLELNHNVNAIVVRGSYAYLATSGNTKDIIILDIHNPAHISQVSSIAFLGNEDTTAISLLGNYLYAGRAYLKSSEHPEFYVVDISTSTAPTTLGSFMMHDAITDIQTSGNNAFVTTQQNSFYKITTENKNNPTILSQIHLQDSPVSLDFENNMLVVALLHALHIETL